MLSTSGDILNIILSVCALILTFFIALAIYYLISSIQKVHKVVKMVESGIIKAEEAISLIKEKVKSGSAYLMVMTEIAKQAMEFAKKRNWSKDKDETGSSQKRKK